MDHQWKRQDIAECAGKLDIEEKTVHTLKGKCITHRLNSHSSRELLKGRTP